MGGRGTSLHRRRGQVLTRCQKEERLRQHAYPLTSTASPRGTGRGQQWLHFVMETNPASPCRMQASFVPSHQVSKSSSELPTLPSQSCILSSCQMHIFSWLFLSFYPRINQQFIKAWEDIVQSTLFRSFLVKLFELQLVLEKHLIEHITWVAPGLQPLSETIPWSDSTVKLRWEKSHFLLAESCIHLSFNSRTIWNISLWHIEVKKK